MDIPQPTEQYPQVVCTQVSATLPADTYPATGSTA
jgi:hypothetical protein